LHLLSKFPKKIAAAIFVLLAILTASTKANAGLYVEHLPQTELLHDGCLHIFILGTGDPEAGMQNIRKPACVALIVDGKVFFFDAGEGSVQTAAGLGLPYANVSKIFMTHWHSDHFGGLGQLINDSWLNGRKEPVDVYGPYGTKQVMAGLEKAYSLDTIFRAATVNGVLQPSLAAAIPHEIDASENGVSVYSDGKLEITCFTVKHTPVVPAFGYTIKYGGAKVVISGDTCVVNSLEKQSKEADVLISEAFSHPLSQKEIDNQQTKQIVEELSSYHADSLELAKMAERASVKHLVLTHLDPAIATTDDAKQAFIEGMPELFKGELTVADDGDQIIIEPKANSQFAIKYVPQKQPQIPVIPRPKDSSPTG
jgi:ribonuclease Z